MLIINNEEIYKPQEKRTVIDSLTRKRIPIVTTSNSLIRAGATISLSPKKSEIIKITTEIANELSANPFFSSPQNNYTENIDIKLNKSMKNLYRINIEGGDFK